MIKNITNPNKYKINMRISKIYVLNAFSHPSKAWNQSPIEYSIEFSLYQRLNSSFGWIFHGFGHLLISRSIFARWGRGTLGWGPGPRAQKCFDRLVNDQIHWISNQMMHSTAGKGKIQWNIQSAIDFKLLRKGKRHLVRIFCYFLKSRPPEVQKCAKHIINKLKWP